MRSVRLRSDGCILWVGPRDRDGYGRAYFAARGYVTAHRLSWWLTHGPIPAGAHVLHDCDRPSCVRVEHLRLGTHAENMADRDAKGRGAVPIRARGGWTGRMRRARPL